jgi:hypothetical protein
VVWTANTTFNPPDGWPIHTVLHTDFNAVRLTVLLEKITSQSRLPDRD